MTDQNSETDSAALHAFLAEHMKWAKLFVSIQEIAEDNTDLVRDLQHYDRASTVPLLAGLLTLPDYQSNCIRLEILVALAVRHCRGRKTAHVEQVKQWFRQVGKSRCALAEDPAEDVFVSLVHDERGNYRLLEGVWEGAGFYTQRVLDVIATMPDHAEFAQLKNCFRALLTVSDIVCDKAGLQRYQLGSDVQHSALLSRKLPGGRALTARVTVTSADLNSRGIAQSDLEPFVFRPHMAEEMDAQQIARSHLDRRPLILNGNEYVVALPSALSIAMRNYVIDQIGDLGLSAAFDSALAIHYAKLFADVPLFGGPTNVQITWTKAGEHRWSDVCLEVDRGYYISVHLFLPSVRTHADAGFKDDYQLDDVFMEELRRSVNAVCSRFADQRGFKGGVVVVVGCGWGKGYATGEFTIQHPKWRFQGMSADDLFRLSWLGNMNPGYFWRIQDGLEAVTKAGVVIQNVNGILNLIGWLRRNAGHFVPHKDLPDDIISPEQPLLLTPPLNLVRDVRSDADAGYDRHRSLDNTGQWHEVQRSSAAPFFDSVSRRRVYVSMDDVRNGTLTSVYEGNLHLWMSVSTPRMTRRDVTYRLWEMAQEWLHRIGAAFDTEVAAENSESSLKVHVEFRDPDLPESGGGRPTPEVLTTLCTIEPQRDPNARKAVFGRGFLVGFRIAENVAERLFVENVVKAYLQILSLDDEVGRVAAILPQVVKNRQARQFHLFHTQKFMDYVSDTLPRELIAIDPTTDAAAKIGLGWKVRARDQGNRIEGREACTSFLASLVDVLTRDIVDTLAGFDRRSTLRRLVANYEKARAEQDHWRRTSAAVLGLHGNNENTRGRFVEQLSKFAGASATSRTLTEIALCACPLDGGGECSNIEMGELIARAALVIRIGGLSDAIYYNALAPEISISPLGDILVRNDFGELVVEPMLTRVMQEGVVAEAPLQERNYEEPEVVSDAREKIGNTFWDVWELEMGFDLNEARSIIGVLEDKGVADHCSILEVRHSDYFKLVCSEAVTADVAGRFLDRFTLETRPQWEEVPEGFTRKDIYPWRFGRRLSFVARPILKVDNRRDPLLVIAPAALRNGFAYVVDGAYNGRFGQSFFRTEKMKNKWWARAHEGHSFNAKVAEAAADAGWNVRQNLGLPELLGRKLERDMGDIDVLAWKADCRHVLVIECKDLGLARNYSEIAALLSDYQGVEVGGKADRLKKHLDRVSLLRNSQEQVQRFTGVPRPEVVSCLVCSGVVPMQYARIEALADTRVGAIEEVLI